MDSKINDAVITLRDELLKHGVLYKAFFESIKSALKESVFLDEDATTKAIMDRIIGEDET